jgi:hypothetical protein
MANKEIARAVRDITISLYYQAEHLRHFEEEEAERIARRLDRLRWDLKKKKRSAPSVTTAE